LYLFLLAAKKKDVIVSFRSDTKILTADGTAGSAAVCKDFREKKLIGFLLLKMEQIGK